MTHAIAVRSGSNRSLKRSLALCAAFLASSASATATTSPPSTGEWRFRVFLGEREIGQHRFVVRSRDGTREVRSEARFVVKVLGLNAFSYVHDAAETWGGECLERIESRTDHNGRPYSLLGQREPGSFRVKTGVTAAELPACVMSFAYWNPRMLEQPRLLNVQTGELVDVKIEARGEESIQAAGSTVTARRYALTGRNVSIDLWYGPDGRWVGLESLTEGGRRLRYVLN